MTEEARIRQDSSRRLASSEEAADSHSVVYEQAMENIRSLTTTGAHVLSVLALANISVVGYLISSRKAATLVLGVAVMLIALVFHRSVRRYMVPYLYTALLFERSYFGDGFLPTQAFALGFLREPKLAQEITNIVGQPDNQAGAATFARAAMGGLLPSHMGIYAFTWLALIGQLALIRLLVMIGWDLI